MKPRAHSPEILESHKKQIRIFFLLGRAVIYHFIAPTPIEPMVLAKIQKSQPPKQTSDNPPQPSGISQDGLVANGLGEGNLAKYFKSPEPRSASGFAIPEQSFENAPNAFSLMNLQPNLWANIYRGKLVGPSDMKFRFAGFGDDALVVQVNGQDVFDGGWQLVLNDDNLHFRNVAFSYLSLFHDLPYCRHVDGLTLNNVDMDYGQMDARPALVCHDYII